MFERLKNVILRRKEPEFEDIRSHVLGEYPPPPAFEPERERRFEPRFGERFERFEPGFEPRGLEIPEIRREPLAIEPRFPERIEERTDILERLNLIEAQLGAIRSQTETINERLKNLEMRLTRRY